MNELGRARASSLLKNPQVFLANPCLLSFLFTNSLPTPTPTSSNNRESPSPAADAGKRMRDTGYSPPGQENTARLEPEYAGAKSSRTNWKGTMCAGPREETWPFSFQFLLLNKVYQIAQNSRQPKFNVEEKEKKKSLFTKRAFEKLKKTLVFSNPAVTGKQATAAGTQRLVLGKHL